MPIGVAPCDSDIVERGPGPPNNYQATYLKKRLMYSDTVLVA